MSKPNLSLNTILDDEFLVTLAKSADLYKIGSNSVLDPEEIRIGLKVVPRAVMSMLISELVPMEINSHKDIKLPFGVSAYISANKNASDDYTGSVYSDNKLVYDFKNRSIPGLGIILLSTFELYDLEELSKPQKETEDIGDKVQKLIDGRMELHSLVGRVVEDKMAQREAIHKLMMDRLSESLQKQAKKNDQIAEITKISQTSAPMSDPYFRGMANGMIVADAVANDKHDPKFVEDPKQQNVGRRLFTRADLRPPVVSSSGPQIKENSKPIEVKPEDIAKKEVSRKKGSPLKGFLARKKNKSKEYKIEMAKSETVNCPDCGQTIFGQTGGYSGCICYGQDQHRKIWLKKTEDGVQIRFSKGWDPDNISQLLETLRKK